MYILIYTDLLTNLMFLRVFVIHALMLIFFIFFFERDAMYFYLNCVISIALPLRVPLSSETKPNLWLKRIHKDSLKFHEIRFFGKRNRLSVIYLDIIFVKTQLFTRLSLELNLMDLLDYIIFILFSYRRIWKIGNLDIFDRPLFVWDLANHIDIGITAKIKLPYISIFLKRINVENKVYKGRWILISFRFQIYNKLLFILKKPLDLFHTYMQIVY